jgi:2-polyprenyl-3-methyl-5-hydroxy-6-metoxy-1,4-benzoquinol methylase
MSDAGRTQAPPPAEHSRHAQALAADRALRARGAPSDLGDRKSVRRALLHLPHSIHLVARLTASRHYHFGLRAASAESLRRSQDHLVRAVAARLPERGAVADIGCGLGGTSSWLAERGLRVLATDPCRRAIRFARCTAPRSPRLRFRVAGFSTVAERARSRGASFDAVLLVEVLQHLPPLATTLERTRGLLRPGGILVIADLATAAELPWERVPFYPVGRVRDAAAGAAFELLDHRDLTPEVAEFPARMILELERARAALVSFFERTRPEIREQIEELVQQCRVLDLSLRRGDLRYELCAWRATKS